MNPVLVDGVLWVPRRAERPGIIGDYMAPLEQSDPEYGAWLEEAVQAEPGVSWAGLEEAITAAAWDESKHKRQPRATPVGGQFARSTTTETAAPSIESLKALGDDLNAGLAKGIWPSNANGTPGEELSYALQGLNGSSRDGMGGGNNELPHTRILTVRNKNGDVIGVGDMSWDDDPDTSVIGGSFGAVQGGGLPLFDSFLTQAADLDKGAEWTAGNLRAKQLYDRMGIPKTFEPTVAEYEQDADKELYPTYADYYDAWDEEFGYQYRLSPEQVRLLADDMFALARSRTAAVEAMVAAGWDESRHPRDPGGEEGGQFVEKSTTAGVELPGGSEEERAKAEAEWANDPEGAKRAEAVLDEFVQASDLQMRVPESVMLEIFNDGEFYNQHQHQEGARGMPRGVEQEARMFGVEATPESLPKYGYMGPDSAATSMYGPIKIVFKDSVLDRTTLTADDSLMQGNGSVVPVPARAPTYLGIAPHTIENATSEDGTVSLWDAVDADYGVPYVEAQIWGRLTPDDIHRVEVLDKSYWEDEDPMSGMPLVEDQAALRRVLDELDRRKIPWSTYTPGGDFSGEWA